MANAVVVGLAALAAVVLVGLVALTWILTRLGLWQRLWLLWQWDARVDRVLEFAHQRHGSRVLIELAQPLAWESRQQWSAGDILAQVERLSGLWGQLGIGRGERVAVCKRNEFDYFLFCVSLLRVGAIATPINARVGPQTTALYLERMGVALLIADESVWQALLPHAPAVLQRVLLTDVKGDAPWSAPLWLRAGAQGPQAKVTGLQAALAAADAAAPSSGIQSKPARGPDDPLYIVHTSGTTGVPKGVILKSEGVAQSLRSLILFNLVSRRDLACLALPLNHQVAQLYLHGAMLLGITCWVNGEFEAPALIAQIEAKRPSLFFAFPITYTRLLAAGVTQRDLSSVRIWGTTADACHEAQQRALLAKGRFFRDLGLPMAGSLFIDGLGSSEVGIAALLRIAHPWTRQFGRRVGRRTPLGPHIRVADAQGQALARGQVGLLMIKGKSMFAGYWNAHDTFYQACRDGWWFTGDVVQQAADGEYLHLDREVDVIHTRHAPVYSLPVEERILLQPGVLDVAVFGIPDGSGPWQCVAAVVALRADAPAVSGAALQAQLNESLIGAQRLQALWIIDWEAFPIGATGKTLKRVLREQYACHPQPLPNHSAASPCTALNSSL